MRGDVDVNMKNEQGEVVNSVLKDALHIPSFPQDIFSVNSAIEQGAELIFKKNASMLIAKDGTKFEVAKRGKLFYIDKAKALSSTRRSRFPISGIPEKVVKKPIVSDTPKKSHSLHICHKIMGHCNKNDVLQLESVVDGMKIIEKQTFQCEPCILGKQIDTRSRKPDERAKAKMDFVHSDLAGPINPTAREGFKYAITFVDDFSGVTFVYFLKKKSDATKALEKFLAESAPFGTITKMRSDGGGEFESGDFNKILINNKIHHEESAPYSPHQNGTVERGWRTLFEMARCLLIESKLPLNLWTYAVMAAVYIRNRCYSQRTKQTPYFLLTDKRPNISNMHIFGTVCYGRKSVGVKKLDKRCNRGIFLGYDKKTPGYIVYYPDTNRIATHRVVTFTDTFDGPEDATIEEVMVEDEFFPHDNDHKNVEQNAGQVEDDAIQDDGQEDEVDDGGHDEIEVDEDEIQDDAIAHDEPPPIRRSNRAHALPEHLGDYVVGNEMDEIVDNMQCIYDFGIKNFEDFDNIDYCFKSAVKIPKTFKQATESNDAERWKIAMDDEINSMLENDTYTLVPVPEHKQIVGGRWVYAIKVEPGGNERYKARYVAKGFSQREGQDYYETFAPTAKMSSVRMLMQVSAELNLIVHQMDVKTAYLNAPIDTEIFMEQPKGYEQENKSCKLVCKLNKSLYGLKQSGRNWNRLFNSFLQSKGFTQSKHDPCVYVFHNNADIAILLIWVDDMILAVSSKKFLNAIKNWLKSRFRMKDLGEISCFLGIHFKQENGCITMSQKQYLKDKLIKYNLDNSKPRSTPCELAGYEKAGSIAEDEGGVDNTLYREMVGSLLYATTCTRPDLGWAVSKLSQHLSNPTHADLVMMKHVFRYVLGTLDNCLSFRKTNDGLKLHGYSDSDWASSLDRKSTSGYVFSLAENGPAIMWKSKKQPTVALSSCEAEYIALCSATQEAVYLSNLFNSLGVMSSNTPIPIYVDNQGTMDLAKNPVSHQRSKHIDIKYHYVRECVNGNKVELFYVPSEDNVSDILTKAVPKAKITKFKSSLFG